MFSSNGFKIIVAGLAIGMALWVGINVHIFAGVLVALVLGATWIVILYFQNNHVSLNEMEVGVLFNDKGNFVCFLDNDYGRIEPGKPRPAQRKKPLSRHTITPYKERMTAIISKGGQKAEGTLNKVRTVEGIPIKVKWEVKFKIIATDILPGIEHKMARGLPANAPGMIGGKASKALTHLIETKSIYDLYRQVESDEGDIGPLQQLEYELRDKVRGLTGIFGADIGNNDVKIGPIELPEGFETALQKMFQKKLQTETIVTSLGKLQDAISQYDDDDIRRLTDLERLRILDEKSGPLMLSESFINMNKNKEVTYNGRSENNGNGENPDY